MLTCNHCGGGNPDGSRFCNQCGTRIATGVVAAVAAPARMRPYTPQHLVDEVLKTRAALQGERKRVTVLFADIKGSTHLAEQAGEEAWHGILDRYFAVLGAVVHRYEGTVNQYTGDGIMALFGAPLAHEDHAQRACYAALDMQRELRDYANELRMSQGLNLAMRIGLNTGDVIVGSIGDDLRMDYTAQGLTVNLAARMEQICEPGRVYCTRVTAALVEGYFRLREIGAMGVDGAAAPVQVYEVEAVGTIRTRLDRALARGAARFVGRERELRRLREAIDGVRAGRGGIVVVTGSPGVGKSRLCHEFALDCERRGIPVHRAAGVPYASALPLHPIIALTRSRLGIAPNAMAAEARRLAAGGLLLFDPKASTLLPQMLQFLGIEGDGVPHAGSAAADGSSLKSFLARFLSRAEEPQVLLIEDLHFADAGTETMLDALCGELAGSRTLALFNFRPEYADGWLHAHAHERVPLAALDDAQIGALARELLGTDPSLDGLAQRLGTRASGNPFFVEEAVQALKESGHLQGGGGAYRLTRAIEDDDWPLPDTVQALVAARIDRLDDDGKGLLQTAAVIGQEFEASMLARLGDTTAEYCRERLRELVRRGLLQARPDGDGEYAFSHPLIQDVAYRTQLERTRAATHARLAAQLEQEHPLNAPPTEAAVAIAHHWRRAAEWERAAQWNLRAA
jgi:adenylate cyclase